MQERKPNRRLSLSLIAGIAGAVLAIGGGAAWWAKSSLNNAEQPNVQTPAPIITEEPPVQPEPITQEKTIEICWLHPTENKIKLVANTLTFEKSVGDNRVLETAMNKLLAGPENSSYTTTIPKGTKLLSLNVHKDGVHVDLSSEFVSGGGSAAMSSRLAQVIYTATSLNNNDRVWIHVNGEALKTLGGEGIVVNQPMTRQDFQDNFTL
jgi:spore germination protein GerM